MSWPDLCISIHALREEGDEDCKPTWTTLENFYPRPPRGGRPSWRSSESGSTSFLSTPSARRATRARSCACRCDTISIHALREEGDRGPAAAADGHLHFYPRPPRGGRPAAAPLLMASVRFLSTPSARRATANIGEQAILNKISIHALREEGDPSISSDRHSRFNFYPRPPRGGRPFQGTLTRCKKLFLSTPSARRATRGGGKQSMARKFLSTPSARRATNSLPWFCCSLLSFLSTPSARRATRSGVVLTHKPFISIHALREEGDANEKTGQRGWS